LLLGVIDSSAAYPRTAFPSMSTAQRALWYAGFSALVAPHVQVKRQWQNSFSDERTSISAANRSSRAAGVL
jgi:hypothetical protein